MSAVWTGLLTAAGTAVIAGAGVEAYALHRRRADDTLSAHIRPWAKKHPVKFIASCGLLVGVGLWLPEHILGGS